MTFTAIINTIHRFIMRGGGGGVRHGKTQTKKQPSF